MDRIIFFIADPAAVPSFSHQNPYFIFLLQHLCHIIGLILKPAFIGRPSRRHHKSAYTFSVQFCLINPHGRNVQNRLFHFSFQRKFSAKNRNHIAHILCRFYPLRKKLHIIPPISLHLQDSMRCIQNTLRIIYSAGNTRIFFPYARLFRTDSQHVSSK